ncbi:unnamed protein product [Knipowitschia caucasica]
MDLGFVLAAAIFTLLAIVVATSLFTGTSPPSDYGRREAGKQRSPLGIHNGHIPVSGPELQKNQDFDWCEMSGSAHDHWDAVKNAQSEEEQLSTDLSRPSSSSSGRGSFIALSDTELLKCAFPPEGATEAPPSDGAESNSFRYLPGKSRCHHLQMMMSREELEEEQRVQREQLSAIFQLLKTNKDTFGDVSQGEVEDQLRLYSL